MRSRRFLIFAHQRFPIRIFQRGEVGGRGLPAGRAWGGGRSARRRNRRRPRDRRGGCGSRIARRRARVRASSPPHGCRAGVRRGLCRSRKAAWERSSARRTSWAWRSAWRRRWPSRSPARPSSSSPMFFSRVGRTWRRFRGKRSVARVEIGFRRGAGAFGGGGFARACDLLRGGVQLSWVAAGARGVKSRRGPGVRRGRGRGFAGRWRFSASSRRAYRGAPWAAYEHGAARAAIFSSAAAIGLPSGRLILAFGVGEVGLRAGEAFLGLGAAVLEVSNCQALPAFVALGVSVGRDWREGFLLGLDGGDFLREFRSGARVFRVSGGLRASSSAVPGASACSVTVVSCAFLGVEVPLRQAADVGLALEEGISRSPVAPPNTRPRAGVTVSARGALAARLKESGTRDRPTSRRGKSSSDSGQVATGEEAFSTGRGGAPSRGATAATAGARRAASAGGAGKRAARAGRGHVQAGAAEPARGQLPGDGRGGRKTRPGRGRRRRGRGGPRARAGTVLDFNILVRM